MNYLAEQHRIREASYQTGKDAEAVEAVLDRFFEGLDGREGLELLDAESDGEGKEYSFRAANSSADVFYRPDSGDGAEVEVEFYGAAPLVDRLYNHFSQNPEVELE